MPRRIQWSLVLLLALGGVAGAQSRATMVSAASYSAGPLAAGQLAAVFGSGLSAGTAVATTTPLPRALGGVSLLVRDQAGMEVAAPLFFVSPGQINLQLPEGLASGIAEYRVVEQLKITATGTIEIGAVSPGLFSADASGKGLAAAGLLRVTAEQTQVWERIGYYDEAQQRHLPDPIDPGAETDQLFLVLYGTGIRNHGGLERITATVGGLACTVLYAGAQGSFTGLDQVNLRLPSGPNGLATLGPGEVAVELRIGDHLANRITIAIRGRETAETIYLATLRPEGSASSPGAGQAVLRLSADQKTAIVSFNYANLTTAVTSAHIHGPADPGQSGQILFDLDTAPRERDGSLRWAISAIGATTAGEILTALRNGRLYLNVHSARYPAGEIRGHFGRVTGSTIFIPPPGPPATWSLPGGPATAREAARLLTQATFGPRMAEITTAQRRGLAGWVDDQLAMAITTPGHLAYLDATTAGKTDIYQQEMMESFWKQAVTAPDQLRQRVVFALSQILVVSFRSNLEGEPFAIAGYLDLLNRNAFGNFRQLLEEITLSPAMGRYLDHLQNDREDPETGRNPNENFAREILQLFSIGLYRLHPDGSLLLDQAGLPIPTYDQETVGGFARVFTGWSYGWFPRTEQNWYWPNTWRNGTAFWRVPMQNWPNHHSQLEKKLLDGAVIPAGQTAEKDLKQALDNIFNHPNVGPFIARQLIQRLVTSHPSPGYVHRVAQRFADNGQGVRGDMKAVLRAILLDYEARSTDLLANQGYGKMREPVVRFAHLLRAFNFTCACGTFPIYWMDSPESALGQNPLRSPTVFNFYEPHYSPPGGVAAAGLHAPEFQLTNETSVIGISNFLHYVVRIGFRWEAEKPLLPDYGAVVALAGNPASLIEHLDLLLTAGGMSTSLKTQLVENIGRLPSNDPLGRVTMAIHLILTSPDYVIQK